MKDRRIRYSFVLQTSFISDVFCFGIDLASLFVCFFFFQLHSTPVSELLATGAGHCYCNLQAFHERGNRSRRGRLSRIESFTLLEIITAFEGMSAIPWHVSRPQPFLCPYTASMKNERFSALRFVFGDSLNSKIFPDKSRLICVDWGRIIWVLTQKQILRCSKAWLNLTSWFPQLYAGMIESSLLLYLWSIIAQEKFW
jgi:hypothetical protein